MICNEYFPFGRLLSLYRSLFEYKIKDEKALKLFNNLIELCKIVAERRNTLLHSIYIPDIQLHQKSNEVTTETISIKFKKDKHIAEILSEDFFEQITSKIENAVRLQIELRQYLNDKGFLVIPKNS